MLAKLQFTDDEQAAIIDTTASQDVSIASDVEFALVENVLSPKPVNETSFIRVLTNLWADEHVEIFQLKPVVFLLKFLTEKYSLNILKRGPWIFDGEPIVLVRFVPSMALGDYKILKMTWWIRVYELALDMMSLDVATKIGLCFFPQTAKSMCYDWENADGTNRICPIQYEMLDRFYFNCAVGLSDKELDYLASIASELGVAPMGQTSSMIDELVDIVQDPIEGNVTGNMMSTEIAQVGDLGKGKVVIRDVVSHAIDPEMMHNTLAQFGAALTVGKDLTTASDEFVAVRKKIESGSATPTLKRIRHGKHRSLSTAKRSRSGANLVAATIVPSTNGIEKAEAVGQPRPTH
ncbi:hypothetical protein GQ457_09G018770 [Hibiscus cannabinus]